MNIKGSRDLLEELPAILDELKANNPSMRYWRSHAVHLTADLQPTIYHFCLHRYVCDPVLGDDGEYYTSPDLLCIYKEKLIPR
jgi:pyridoxal/pyridoxine/pyridoxamine kinase